MAKYICDVCGYEYDPNVEGKAFNGFVPSVEWGRTSSPKHNNNPFGTLKITT